MLGERTLPLDVPPQGGQLGGPRRNHTSSIRPDTAAEFDQDIHARSATSTITSLWSTWCLCHSGWYSNHKHLPLNHIKVRGAAILVSTGKYRSFPNCMSVAKD